MKIYAKGTFRESRIKSGYSIVGLSKEIGMTKQGLGQFERQVNGITPENAKVICCLLGVSFDDAFELKERGEL